MKNNEDRIFLNDEQEAAIGLLKSGVNVFLTGEAGTGKSTLVREFIRRCGHECIVLAPTGIASLNAGGTTIHSQMMFKPGLLDPLNLEPLSDGSRWRVLLLLKSSLITARKYNWNLILGKRANIRMRLIRRPTSR